MGYVRNSSLNGPGGKLPAESSFATSPTLYERGRGVIPCRGASRALPRAKTRCVPDGALA